MKRFHLLPLVFALVCGCHIIGVQSYGWSWRYLDPNGICPPFHDQSPVVKIIPGLKTCGGRYTSLRVGKYKSIKGDSLEKCKLYCQSDTKCAYAEFDKNKETCSFAGKESFGANVEEGIVTGHDECPPIGKCPYVGTDYADEGYGRTSGVNSPRDCQTYCRKTYGSNATIDYGFSNKYCYCKYAFGFTLGFHRKWISGPLRCHPCFGYKTDLSNLANVHNGSLIKPTVEACQKSCKDNPLCDWFEFKPWTGECRHKNPLTARMNKKDTGFASRDCNRIHGPPFDDQSPVVKIIPRLETCSARGTSLMVGKYKSIIGDSLKTCQKFCQSDEECAFAVFDKKKGLCSFAGKESFGANVAEHIITGLGECPKIGKCPYVGTDYSGYGHGRTFNIYSPEDCQRYCIRTYGNKAAINYGLSAKVCYCKYAFNFGLNSYSKWISGPLRCPPCLKFKYDLSNLENVYNGSPNPFLIKPTVKACQKSCEDNPRCLWFEYKPRNRECRHKNPLTARMNKCNAAVASRDCNGIGACICDLYGSKGKKGECPCWLDSYAGRCHQRNLSTEIFSNGQCCFKRYYYNLKTKDCENCRCFGRGAKSWLCHGDKGGQCICHNGYKGRRCNDATEHTFGNSKDFTTNRHHRAVHIECNGNCDILRIETKNSNVWLGIFLSKTLEQRHGVMYWSSFDICTSPGTYENPITGNARCSYSKILNANKFYILLDSKDSLRALTLSVKIPNYKTGSLVKMADLPAYPG